MDGFALQAQIRCVYSEFAPPAFRGASYCLVSVFRIAAAIELSKSALAAHESKSNCFPEDGELCFQSWLGGGGGQSGAHGMKLCYCEGKRYLLTTQAREK